MLLLGQAGNERRPRASRLHHSQRHRRVGPGSSDDQQRSGDAGIPVPILQRADRSGSARRRARHPGYAPCDRQRYRHPRQRIEQPGCIVDQAADRAYADRHRCGQSVCHRDRLRLDCHCNIVTGVAAERSRPRTATAPAARRDRRCANGRPRLLAVAAASVAARRTLDRRATPRIHRALPAAHRDEDRHLRRRGSAGPLAQTRRFAGQARYLYPARRGKRPDPGHYRSGHRRGYQGSRAGRLSPTARCTSPSTCRPTTSSPGASCRLSRRRLQTPASSPSRSGSRRPNAASWT